MYHFTVLEDIGIGDPIGRVKANDLDIGENARSAYDIIDGDGIDIFDVTSDPQTQEGIIRLRKVNGETEFADLGVEQLITGHEVLEVYGSVWKTAIPSSVS